MNTMKERVAVFGDSLFKGVVYDEGRQRYKISKPCVNRVLEKENMLVDNYSKFGLTTDKALDYIKINLSKEADYKYAIIELGGNDCDYKWSEIANNPYSIHYPNVKIEDFEKNIIKIVEEIKKYDIIPMIATMPPISSKKYFNWFSRNLNKENILLWLEEEDYIYKHHEMYSQCLINLAYKLNVQIIDLRFSLLTIKNFNKYLCVDGIHLNEDGHKFLEQSFSKGEV